MNGWITRVTVFRMLHCYPSLRRFPNPQGINFSGLVLGVGRVSVGLANCLIRFELEDIDVGCDSCRVIEETKADIGGAIRALIRSFRDDASNVLEGARESIAAPQVRESLPTGLRYPVDIANLAPVKPKQFFLRKIAHAPLLDVVPDHADGHQERNDRGQVQHNLFGRPKGSLETHRCKMQHQGGPLETEHGEGFLLVGLIH
eukprot:jgi/Psemu1/301864/fgenesh1_kg.50_\